MNALIDTLNRAAEGWWELALRSAWQATLVAAVILLAVAVLRRASAPFRYALLLVALAKFATPAVWPASWTPFSADPTSLVAEHFLSAADVGTDTTTASAALHNGPPDSLAAAPAKERAPAAGAARMAAQDPRAGAPPDAAAGAAMRDVVRWSEEHPARRTERPSGQWSMGSTPGVSALRPAAWGLILHGLGTLCMLAWLLIQAVRLRRCLKTSMGASEAQRRELADTAARLGVRRIPELRSSHSCSAPFAAGLFRPHIVLPAGSMRALSTMELRSMLGHELMHIRRGDLWVNLFQLLVRAVWWWHPLVWYLHRQLRTVREDCCDDAILARRWVDTDGYCRTLLKIARGSATGWSQPGLSISMAAGHPLARRIRRIMNPAINRPGRLGVPSGAVVLGFAFLVLPGAPVVKPSQAEERPVQEDSLAADSVPRNEQFRVLDERGQPLDGCGVALSYRDPYAPFWQGPAVVWHSETAADGRPNSWPSSALHHDEHPSSETLWIYGPEVGLAAVPVENLQNPLAIQAVSLGDKPPAMITMVDAEGRPAAGAEVRVRSVELDDCELLHVPDVIAEALVATTNADGKVELPVCHRGALRSIELTTADGLKEIIETAQIRAPAPVPWPERIAASPTGRVTGAVKMDGQQELRGTRIRLISHRQHSPNAQQQFTRHGLADVAIEADGTFSVGAVVAGSLTGAIYRDDQWLGPIPEGRIVQPGGELVLELELAEQVAVSFPIVDAEDGSPVPEAHVTSSFMAGGICVVASAHSTAGRPAGLHLPAGAHHTFTARLPSPYVAFPTGTLRVAVPEQTSQLIAPPLRVLRGGTLRGQVRHLDGSPASGTRVVASWEADPQQKYRQRGGGSAEVGSGGRYQLTVPKDRRLAVRVLREGTVIAKRDDVRWEETAGGELTLVVPSQERVPIAGRVLTAAGEPLAGVSLHLRKISSNGINTASSSTIATIKTDSEGKYRTQRKFDRHGSYRVQLDPRGTRQGTANAPSVADRTEDAVVMQDLVIMEVEPLSAVAQPAGRAAVNDEARQSPTTLKITVNRSTGAPAEAARVVVWSAGDRVQVRTGTDGRAEIPAVKSAAWVIAGPFEDHDSTGLFVSDASQPVHLDLPPAGRAAVPAFGNAAVPQPMHALMAEQLERFVQRVIIRGSEFQRQKAMWLWASVDPESALQQIDAVSTQSANGESSSFAQFARNRLRYVAGLKLADHSPQRAMEAVAAIDDPVFLATAQAQLVERLPEQMKQQQADAAAATARQIDDPGSRCEALTNVARHLRSSGLKGRAEELVREAVALAPEPDEDDKANFRRGCLAVELGLLDLPAAERLLPRHDGSTQASFRFNQTRADLAEQLAGHDPPAAERLLEQLDQHYHDRVVPRVVYAMARVDQARAERLAEQMSGPGGKLYAQAAIAMALCRDNPAEARRRLLNTLERLEELSDRPWRTGEDYFQPLKVGVTLLPWVARVAPDRMEDAFWRVLALRGERAYGTEERLLGDHGPDGTQRLADPVLAAFLSYFDTEAAQLLVMPPDDTALDVPGYAPQFFFAGLAAIDPAAAFRAMENLPESDPQRLERKLAAWEELVGLLSREGLQRWKWLQEEQYYLQVAAGGEF